MSSLSNNNTVSKSMNGLIVIDADAVNSSEIDVDTLVINVSGTAPTIANPLDNSTNIATTAWVTNHAGAGYVTINTSQTLGSGIKTFSNLPECSVSASTNNQLVNLNTLNNAISTAGNDYVHITGTETITGQKTFNSANTTITDLYTEYINNTEDINSKNVRVDETFRITDTLFSQGPTEFLIQNFLTGGNYKFRTYDTSGFGRTALNLLTDSATFYNNVISPNITSNNIIGTGATQNLYTTLATGVINIGTATGRSGKINIGNNTTATGDIEIGNQTPNGGNIKIGSFTSSTQKITMHSQDFGINRSFSPINNVGSFVVGGAYIGLSADDTNCSGNFTVNNIIGGSGANLTITTSGTDDVTMTTGGDILLTSGLTISLKTTNATALTQRNVILQGANNETSLSTAGYPVIENHNKLGTLRWSNNIDSIAPTFPLESIYLITGLIGAGREYVLPQANNNNIGAIFKVVNSVSEVTGDYFVRILTTGTQYITMGNGDMTLNLQEYQMQDDEQCAEFVYIGSNYWLCMSRKPSIPSGTIITYPKAMDLTNQGLQNYYVLCDGTAYNANTGKKYKNLFRAIGNTYGGTDNTNFKVPNLNGMFIRGQGSQVISSKTYAGASVGTVQGEDTIQHKHTYSDMYWYDENAGVAGQTILLNGANYENPSGDNNGSNTDGNYSKRMTSAKIFTASSTQTNPATDPTPEITGFETRPINYSMYFYIKL